jgi:hypothetical protein
LPPVSIDKLPESERMNKYIDMLAEQADGKAPAGVVGALRPCLLKTIGVCLAIQPWAAFVSKYASRLWGYVPTNVAYMLFGGALCYFGGTFSVSIAAIEAFRTMGYSRAVSDLSRVREQVDKAVAASEKDDLVDEDGDGVADVDQISTSELMRRKLHLIAISIEEPERIQAAVASVWAACLAVIATLKLDFAATTAIGLGIADMIRGPAVSALTPALLKLTGRELKHWAIPTIESSLSLIAIMVAWQMQMVLCALYASIRGGRLFAAGFFGFLVEQAKAGVQICPGLVGENFDMDGSMLDEVVGYIIAIQGFAFQMSEGFTVPRSSCRITPLLLRD